MRFFRNLFLNETFILVLILINAVSIMIGAFDGLSLFVRNLVMVVDNTITVLFIIELLIKLSHYGIRTYFSQTWNVFDFILIVISLPALVSLLLGMDLEGMSFFLVFRVLRVFKSFRFLKFIPGINDLISGIRRALKTSLVILLGFAVYIFIIGLLSCYLFKGVCPEYFSDPMVSFYSTFTVFTMEGWTEIPELIASNTSSGIAVLSKIYFVFILITGGILGLSLVNSIFVDAMLSDDTEMLEERISDLDTKLDTILQRLDSEQNLSE